MYTLPLFSSMAHWPVLLFLWACVGVQLFFPKDGDWTARVLKGRQLVTLLSLVFPEAKGNADRKQIHFGFRMRAIFTCNLLYF